MWEQVDKFGEVVKQINKENPNGVHLLCYSQGGLICRGIVETFSVLNVRTFVSLSSPQGGQYGGILNWTFIFIARQLKIMGSFRFLLENDFKNYSKKNRSRHFLQINWAKVLGGKLLERSASSSWLFETLSIFAAYRQRRSYITKQHL